MRDELGRLSCGIVWFLPRLTWTVGENNCSATLEQDLVIILTSFDFLRDVIYEFTINEALENSWNFSQCCSSWHPKETCSFSSGIRIGTPTISKKRVQCSDKFVKLLMFSQILWSVHKEIDPKLARIMSIVKPIPNSIVRLEVTANLSIVEAWNISRTLIKKFTSSQIPMRAEQKRHFHAWLRWLFNW